MSFERIVALLPMRHHSVRVPGKNYRLIAGKALYRHVLDTLLAVPEISEVVVIPIARWYWRAWSATTRRCAGSYALRNCAMGTSP